MATPIEPDENGNCPEGYKKNSSTGMCEPICSGGKLYNKATKKCECPFGKMEDSSGNCIIDPCYYLKQQIDPNFNNIKPALTDLKSKVKLPGERGYAFIKDGNNYLNKEIAVSVLEFDNVRPPVGSKIYGGAHSHTLDLHNMFSWSDVFVLYSFYKNTDISLRENVIYYLVGWNDLTNTEEVHALTISDFAKLESRLNKDIINIVKLHPDLNGNSSVDKAVNKLNDFFKHKYRSSTDLSYDFLTYFKNHGIELYKADNNINNFSKVSINPTTNKTVETPCK